MRRPSTSDNTKAVEMNATDGMSQDPNLEVGAEREMQ